MSINPSIHLEHEPHINLSPHNSEHHVPAITHHISSQSPFYSAISIHMCIVEKTGKPDRSDAAAAPETIQQLHYIHQSIFYGIIFSPAPPPLNTHCVISLN